MRSLMISFGVGIAHDFNDSMKDLFFDTSYLNSERNNFLSPNVHEKLSWRQLNDLTLHPFVLLDELDCWEWVGFTSGNYDLTYRLYQFLTRSFITYDLDTLFQSDGWSSTSDSKVLPKSLRKASSSSYDRMRCQFNGIYCLSFVPRGVKTLAKHHESNVHHSNDWFMSSYVKIVINHRQ